MQRKVRKRLRRDIKRGTVAYIDALAGTKRGVVDDALLVKCRVTSEQQMPHALGHQELLGRIMANEPDLSMDWPPRGRTSGAWRTWRST